MLHLGGHHVNNHPQFHTDRGCGLSQNTSLLVETGGGNGRGVGGDKGTNRYVRAMSAAVTGRSSNWSQCAATW